MFDRMCAVVVDGKVLAMFPEMTDAIAYAEPLRGEGERVLDYVQSAPVFMSWSTVGKIAGEGNDDPVGD